MKQILLGIILTFALLPHVNAGFGGSRGGGGFSGGRSSSFSGSSSRSSSSGSYSRSSSFGGSRASSGTVTYSKPTPSYSRTAPVPTQTVVHHYGGGYGGGGGGGFWTGMMMGSLFHPFGQTVVVQSPAGVMDGTPVVQQTGYSAWGIAFWVIIIFVIIGIFVAVAV